MLIALAIILILTGRLHVGRVGYYRGAWLTVGPLVVGAYRDGRGRAEAVAWWHGKVLAGMRIAP